MTPERRANLTSDELDPYRFRGENSGRYTHSPFSLPGKFAEAVAATVEVIAAAPLQFAVVEEGRRWAEVRRFPIRDILFPSRKPVSL